jgi:hypothetical protein
MDFLSSLLLFRALSQEACAFVFDQALFDDEEVEVLSIPADGFYVWKRQRNQEVPMWIGRR